MRPPCPCGGQRAVLPRRPCQAQLLPVSQQDQEILHANVAAVVEVRGTISLLRAPPPDAQQDEQILNANDAVSVQVAQQRLEPGVDRQVVDLHLPAGRRHLDGAHRQIKDDRLHLRHEWLALKQTFTGIPSLASFRATATRRTAGCELSSKCAASNLKWAGLLAYNRGNKNATRRIAPARHLARHRLRIRCGSAQPQRSQGGVRVWPHRLTARPTGRPSPNRRDPGRSSRRRSDQIGAHRHGWLVRATCGGRHSHAVSLPDRRRCT